jgi:hypothetical protein
MKPIFIGGCGRSGTTLLASLLAGHSHVVAPPEAQFFLEGLAARERAESPLAAFAASVAGSWRYRLWGLPATLPAELAREHRDPAEIMRRIAGAYAKRHGEAGADRWVDHTPINVGFAPTLLGEFEDARLIHLIRDPRAVVASVLPLDWGPASARQAARWWLSRIAMGLAAEAAFPDRVIRVRYEDLVVEPEACLRHLFLALGLEFEATVLGARRASLPGYTRGQHALVGRPPDPDRIEAWRSTLSTEQVATVEAELKETTAMLGYRAARTLPPVEASGSAMELLTDAIRTARQRFTRRGRLRRALREPESGSQATAREVQDGV